MLRLTWKTLNNKRPVSLMWRYSPSPTKMPCDIFFFFFYPQPITGCVFWWETERRTNAITHVPRLWNIRSGESVYGCIRFSTVAVVDFINRLLQSIPRCPRQMKPRFKHRTSHITNTGARTGPYHSVPADDDRSPVTVLFQNIPTETGGATMAEGFDFQTVIKMRKVTTIPPKKSRSADAESLFPPSALTTL